MAFFRQVKGLLHGSNHLRFKQKIPRNLGFVCYYSYEEQPHEEHLPLDWYEKSFPKLANSTHLLKNLDLIDGRLIDLNDNSIIFNSQIEQEMHTFKSLARAFIGCPSVQQTMKTNIGSSFTGSKKQNPPLPFNKPSEREPITVNSLTKVCNFLNISAQQRKLVRLNICPQVTQHQILTGSVMETLNNLKSELGFLNHRNPSKEIQMGHQIVANCLDFLHNTLSYDPDSTTSWMRLAPKKPLNSTTTSHKWVEVAEMFRDLIECLRDENGLIIHVKKLDAMKEGLYQIKDVLIDKNIGYKESRHQESLVQKKLTKTLGHSSRCLFTLLLYYLYGGVWDVEVEVCGGVYGGGGGGDNKFYLCMGKILSSGKEKAVLSGVKQLDRALRLFKFVWEMAGMKGGLELQGHFWYVGVENRSFSYRGNVFFVHGINL